MAVQKQQPAVSKRVSGPGKPEQVAKVQSKAPEVPVISHESQTHGKPGLPEPDVEPEKSQFSDREAEAVNYEEVDVSFTEEDKRDLIALEKKVEAGKRQAFEALRTVRQRQLWRLIRNDEAEQLYKTFDEYVEDRWGHTRQWVTHGTNWLAITEEMERLGITDPPHLTVKAAQGLLFGRLNNAGGLRAVLEEAKQDGVPFDRDHLQELVLRRADYNYWSVSGREGITKPAAPSYAEYKKDSAVAKQLQDSGSHSLFDEAATASRNESSQGTGLADALVMISRQKLKMPDRGRLLANFTGVALEELVERLKEVAQEIDAIEEKKKLLAERQQEIKSLQEGGIKKLKDEAKALETELVAVGAITRKAKKQEPSQKHQEDAGRGTSDQDNDEAGEDSEVCTSLDTALANLEEALSCEWPNEGSELNSIFLKVQECEAKLGEINAKAKELLADAEEPETVPIGDTN